MTKCSDHFIKLMEKHIPFLFFDRVAENLKTSQVVVDDEKGAYNAVEFLIKRGYQRIAHIAGPEYISISKARRSGYKRALNDYNLSINDNYIVQGGLNEKDGVKGFNKLLQLKEKPDAIFAVNDPVAIGVFVEMKKRELKIPKDFALIGYSNNPVVSLIDPPLTTVEQPMMQMGKEAAKLLINQIENKNRSQRRIVLETKLIIRESA